MLIRNGISANDKKLDQISDQMNGWFADLAERLLDVPEVQTLPTDSLTASSVASYDINYRIGRSPDFVLIGTYDDTAFLPGRYGGFVIGAIDKTRTAFWHDNAAGVDKVPDKIVAIACFLPGVASGVRARTSNNAFGASKTG